MSIDNTPSNAAADNSSPAPADNSVFEAELASIFGVGPASEEALPGEPLGAEGLPAVPGAEVPPTSTSAPVPPTVAEPLAATPPIPAAPAQAPQQGLPPAIPAQPAVVPAAPDPKDLELENLKATVAALQAQLQQPAAGTPAQPGAATPSSGDPAAQLPQYGLAIPDNVAAMVFGEDPAQAKAGLEHIVNSVLTIAHTRVRKEFDERLTAMQSAQRQEAAQSATATQVDEIKRDYYTAFPTHNHPAVAAVLAEESAKMAASYPNLPWSEQYRNALGTRVNTRLQELQALGGAPAAPAPVPGTPVPSAPAAMTPLAPRPAAPTGGQTDEDLLLETFKFN